jgi:YD repeat-containing protein
MSRAQELRDRNGHLLGRITETSSTRHEIRDANGHLLGYFNPQSNETRDANGHLVGRGNLLASLLR